MLAQVTATPKPYDWGSATAIPHLLGQEPTGKPQAELWFGAHPGSITTLAGAGLGADGHLTLQDWLSSHGARLPFLVKLLAADRPLSLQAHPTLHDAGVGFAAENAAGIPVDAATRNHKDAWHKPELIVALQDGFQALCGFRPIDETADLLGALASTAGAASSPLTRVAVALSTSGLAHTVRTVLTEPSGDLTNALSSATAMPGPERWAPEWALLRRLTELYPADPGTVIASLMNFVTIDQDEALFLPAGNIHAYVGGVGVEIMAASDNVLRGGLTSKNVDATELLRILEFTPVIPDVLVPNIYDSQPDEYTVPVNDFRLLRIRQRTIDIGVEHHTIALVTDGTAELTGGGEQLHLRAGEAAFVTADQHLRVSSSGTTFIATSRPL